MTAQPPAGEVTQRCYRHPNREALIRCTRCDRPICPDCMRPASVGFHCPDDVAEARQSVRAPRTTVGAKLLDSPPYVTTALIVANVAVYLWVATRAGASLSDPTTPVAPSSLYYKWQLQPLTVHDDGRYYTLLTSAFLHIGLLHIASNMIALAFIGPSLERLLGRWRFLSVYLLSALGGSAAIYAFGDQITTTVGASGAVFGLFGVALVLARRLGLDLQWLVAIIALNFVFTFSVHHISKLGHVGGFLTGLLAALVIGGPPQLRSRIPLRLQVGGLAGLFALIVVVVAVRSATF